MMTKHHDCTMNLCRTVAACLAWLALADARAGGHFDVDDAGTLGAGQCQYELWAGRIGGAPSSTGLHLGPACGVGAVELGLDLDRTSTAGQRSVAWVGSHAKWTFYGRADDAPLSAALSAGVVFDATRGGRPGGQLMMPISWNAFDSLQLNANVGVDWLPGSGTRTGRAGFQAVWPVTDAVSIVAERNRAYGYWTSRIGARFTVAPTISIDVSAARIGTETGRLRGVVVGVNQTFGGR